MAFGQTRQQETRQKTEESSDEKVSFAWPWIPIKGGTTDKRGNVTSIKGGLRKVRLLPALDAHGQLVEVPFTDRNGAVVKGKMTTVPATEVRFVEIWWTFMVNGSEKKQRIWIDWQGDGRWNNPFWEGCDGFVGAKAAGKDSDERKAMKEYFAVNVVDKTPVLFDDQGYPVYPDENGKYVITALGTLLKEPLKGDPEPLNQIRILQGTSGRTDPPGKHFFQSFVRLIGTVENPDNPKFVYNIHEFDISINVKGAGVSTERSANPTLNLRPLPDEFVFAPRYDLATWAKPWPNEAIEKLFAGHDYFEVMKEYEIQQYPQLKAVRDPSWDNAPFDDSVPAVSEHPEAHTEAKKSRGKKKVEESEDLFDD